MSPDQMKRKRLAEKLKGNQNINHPIRRAMLSGISDQGEDLKSAQAEKDRFAAEMQVQEEMKKKQDSELKDHRADLDGESIKDRKDKLSKAKKIGKLVAGMSASPYESMSDVRMPKYKDKAVDVMKSKRKALMKLIGR